MASALLQARTLRAGVAAGLAGGVLIAVFLLGLPAVNGPGFNPVPALQFDASVLVGKG